MFQVASTAEASSVSEYVELATALPSVLINLTNYSGIVRKRNESLPHMAHHFGDFEGDLDFLYDVFEGFWVALNKTLDGSDRALCPHRSYQHISACLSLALCVIQSVVPAQIEMDYFSSLMELEQRFQHTTWPTIHKAHTFF